MPSGDDHTFVTVLVRVTACVKGEKKLIFLSSERARRLQCENSSRTKAHSDKFSARYFPSTLFERNSLTTHLKRRRYMCTYYRMYLSSALSTHCLSPRVVFVEFIENTDLPYWYHSPVQLEGNSQAPGTQKRTNSSSTRFAKTRLTSLGM